jgi:hypothetical protein
LFQDLFVKELPQACGPRKERLPTCAAVMLLVGAEVVKSPTEQGFAHGVVTPGRKMFIVLIILTHSCVALEYF